MSDTLTLPECPIKNATITMHISSDPKTPDTVTISDDDGDTVEHGVLKPKHVLILLATTLAACGVLPDIETLVEKLDDDDNPLGLIETDGLIRA